LNLTVDDFVRELVVFAFAVSAAIDIKRLVFFFAF